MTDKKELNIEELIEIGRKFGGIAEGETEGINEDRFSIICQAIDSASNGIAISNLHSIINYVNNSFLRMFEYEKREEIIGKNIASLFPSEKIKSFIDIEAIVNKSEEETEEFIVTRKDGGLFHVELYPSKIVDRNGKSAGHIFFFTNISKRKAVQERLAHSEEQLRISNAAKDKLFSIIAHDLRGSIGNLISYEEVIRESAYEKELTIDLLNHFFDNARSAVALMENLLNWAQSQLDRIKFTPSDCNITQMIRDNMKLIAPAAEKKSIAVLLEGDEELWAYCDHNMINIVVRNLLANAVKFTPEGGKVEISTEVKNKLVEVFVSDSGKGLSKERFEEILLPHRFVTTKGTKGETGTGLGLKLCAEFIERNGGTLVLNEDKGKGATFSFTLPLRQ